MKAIAPALLHQIAEERHLINSFSLQPSIVQSRYPLSLLVGRFLVVEHFGGPLIVEVLSS